MLLMTIIKQFKTLAQIHLGNILNLLTILVQMQLLNLLTHLKILANLQLVTILRTKNSSIDAAETILKKFIILVQLQLITIP